MRNNKEEILVIDEDFSCSKECLIYYLNQFGELDVAYSAGRITKKTYKRNYKWLDYNLKENMKLLKNKSQVNLALGREKLSKDKTYSRQEIRLTGLMDNERLKKYEDNLRNLSDDRSIQQIDKKEILAIEDNLINSNEINTKDKQ